ncbi:ComF family protein [Aneurinibacillus aneurinilyticus]|uniref:ComF family protein n=2 Tax=Aneurinibacillus aneurinilyticus TaxID=1391 RepID=A0A848D4E0_ANEAE|nr:ComF family protein [Aneurinibacillus aneurinilyticus]ERI08461.1 comF family protein [Aneurinibacillus aneurinilyticus ATCC 12856]MED0708246.1 ComF family protein [Aneurinibacillus aneurinilyticus]MED0724672.1 ComF family protein [Aneurinibacillus aneurinilyticus]MED0730573.1 ComF family protein [Aneurinibacillus aneurinilyticus]MED0743444.1 ComF family protein [Aneurinibacillus aneurinilyticus]
MNGWQSVVNGILNLLYPSLPLCSLCAQPVRYVAQGAGEKGGTVPLCAVCKEQFAFILDNICKLCGRPWIADTVCEDCARRTERYIHYSRSAVRYNEAMKGLLAQYKYRGDRKLADVMVSLLLRAWRLHYAGMKVDCLTYIPLHEARLLERTFNQAQEMACLLAHEVGVPLYGLLERKKATEKQSKQDRTSRLNALQNVFHFSPEEAFMLPDCPVIVLIDDVYTTGATLAEAGRAIKEGIPQANVYGLTVAR